MSIKLINASAGTGKTHALTEAVVALIKSNEVSADRMLITTFTVKAAEELVGRIRAKLLKSGLKEQVRKLPLARIGTVNGICDGLVREFAYELGFSPAVEVAGETREATLLTEATLAAVETADMESLSDLMIRMSGTASTSKNHGDGKTDWERAVEDIVKLARTNRMGPDALRTFRDRSWEELRGACFSCQVISGLQQQMRQALSECINFSVTNRKVSDALQTDHYTWGDWQKALNFPKRDGQVIEIARKVLQHPQLRKDMEDQLRMVYDTAARTLEIYEKSKKALSLIDYIDQEVFVLQLLERVDFQREISSRFDVVMVDEFQDTSPLQLELFLRLKSLVKHTIWVGDPKQAIYGFRGADPELMNAAADDLEHESEVEIVSLRESWRSRAALCAKTSDWFVPAFRDAHKIPEDRVRISAAKERGPEPPGVREAVVKWSLNGSREDARMASLADGVAGLLAEDKADIWVPKEKTASPRRLAARDIAILCRTNEQCRMVTQSLAGREIAVSSATSELLLTPEARLVMAGMKRWLNPHDKLAAAEISRLTLVSPDDEVAWLNQMLNHETVCESNDWVAKLDAAREAQSVAGCALVFEAMFDVLPVVECILRWGNRDQRIANLEALRGHLEDYISGATGPGPAISLPGFILYMEILKEQGRDTGGVQQGDAVTVLTFHAAKGLEWPVVILYQWDGIKDSSALGVQLQRPVKFDPAHPLEGRWIRYWPNPLSSKTINAVIHGKLSPENDAVMDMEKRNWLNLVYVGMTRAATQLILTVQEDNPEISFLNVDLPADSPPQAPESNMSKATTVSWYDEPRGPFEHAPARIQPSAMEATGSVRRVDIIGDRFPLAPNTPMEKLGNAIHHYFAAAESANADDLPALALRCLQAQGVSGHLEASTLVDMRERLLRWMVLTFGEAGRYVEWPVTCFTENGSFLEGRIDLLIETSQGWIIIDHKSFPGDRAQLEHRAARHAGQLQAYADAFVQATGKPVAGTFIHFGIAGLIMECHP